MTSCSGLPVCLSGIQISSQARLPHQNLRSPHGDLRARSNSRRRELGVCDPPSLASEFCTSNNLDTPLTSFSPTEKLEHGCISDCSNSGQMRMKWPRLAIAKEMADLDRRREAHKKQHGLRNAMHLMEEYMMFREERDSFLACFRRKSRQQNQSDCPHMHFCAKAA